MSPLHCSFQNYVWFKRGTKIQQKDKVIEPRASLIASVDSLGNIYASLFHGNSNNYTTILMLYHLCKTLDDKYEIWRSSSILLLDGASNHQHKKLKRSYRYLNCIHPRIHPKFFEKNSYLIRIKIGFGTLIKSIRAKRKL